MSKSLLALATLISVGLSAPAIAGSGFGEPPSKTVRTDDLNLATLPGQMRLEQRVKSAARSICRTGSRELAMMVAEQKCFETAMKSAQVQVAALVQRAVRAKS